MKAGNRLCSLRTDVYTFFYDENGEEEENARRSGWTSEILLMTGGGGEQEKKSREEKKKFYLIGIPAMVATWTEPCSKPGGPADDPPST